MADDRRSDIEDRIAIALAGAKRVRQESTMVIRQLAAVRDALKDLHANGGDKDD